MKEGTKSWFFGHLNTTEHSIHKLIKDTWYILKIHNTKGKESTIYALQCMKENIDSMIHHLQNS